MPRKLEDVTAECVRRGLPFGWHPGYNLPEGDSRRDWLVPQDGGWWCRELGDPGMDTRMFPSLEAALDDLDGK